MYKQVRPLFDIAKVDDLGQLSNGGFAGLSIRSEVGQSTSQPESLKENPRVQASEDDRNDRRPIVLLVN